MAVKPIPDGFNTITPYLILEKASDFLSFIEKAFDAQIVSRHDLPDGKVMHAEFKIGDSMMMLAESSEKYPAAPGIFYVYVPDTDSSYKKAVDAGATSEMEPADQFYGDRTAGVRDTFGNRWWIGTHIEDLSPEEIQKREKEYMKNKK